MAYSNDQVAGMKALGFITIAEAVRLSHQSRTTIFRWLKCGDIAAKSSGKRRFVDLESLRRMMGPLMPKESP